MIAKYWIRSAAIGWVLASSVPVMAQDRVSLNTGEPGVHWQLKAQGEVGNDSLHLFDESFKAEGWVDAVVPGCVFASFVAAGIEKDPNFGDNIYRVDRRKYDRNFWYRTSFASPAMSGEKCWLHFAGINRKGDVFLNGTLLGRLDGFMQRGDFDVTGILSKTGKNILAVLVYWPGKPIANHASPTYISSDGWDWMPSVPGLLQGITDEVFLSLTGAVVIDDPWIRTTRLSGNDAALSIKLGLKNRSDKLQRGNLLCTIQPGNIKLSKSVNLAPGAAIDLGFDDIHDKELLIRDAALWWPNGYGNPNLYTATFSFNKDGQVSDVRQISFGIRQYSYDTIGSVLHISVNGKKIFVRGGNWGMSEYLLRCRGKQYDVKMRLHQEMHLNMIRNWIGSITDEAFYDACDRYGMMVWDDFWLNSHPNLPDDIDAFNRNAVEKIKRFRNHASIAVWCGDNESDPLPPLNGWLREDVKTFDGGDRLYQPNSHAGALTGSGPWTNSHPTWYFTKYPGGFGGSPGWGFRTEIGTAVFTTVESFKKFIPTDALWPRNEMWNKHFFGQSAANGGPDRFESTINKSYGTASGIEDFCRKAQLVNIETNKALYEGWQHHIWDDASGVMTWMSQSAYPSLVWQTYDYYNDLTGAYWGVKKACEPVHIQWSYADNSVKVVNTTLRDLKNIRADAVVYNLNGRVAKSYGRTAVVDAPADTAITCFNLNFSIDNLAYKKMAVASSGASEAPDASAVSDGSIGTRWSSAYTDSEWVYVDLGTVQEISGLSLNWETAYGRSYKIQVSTDAKRWSDVYSTRSGKGGIDKITLQPVNTRYVKMQGIERATRFGYSLYDIEIYGKKTTMLSDVHFIRLYLRDEGGNALSDNFYWRSNQLSDYTALNTMEPAKLKWTSRLIKKANEDIIELTIANAGSGPAFAIHVQAMRKADGERILPAFMNDNYFTLFSEEKKTIEFRFDPSLLPDGQYKLSVEPYNK